MYLLFNSVYLIWFDNVSKLSILVRFQYRTLGIEIGCELTDFSRLSIVKAL